jgi:hypothetical protein
MAVQTISTTSDIPKVLDPFYLGRPGKGTVGQPGYEKPYTGLIDRGFSAIYPDDLAGAEAYARQFAPLIEQGLVGAGTVAPMSQFQQALGTQLGGMTMPDQFALAEQTGQAGAAGLQALLGVQAPEFGSTQAEQYMSPYFQNVVDAQQRQAIDAARQSQLGGNLAAARQGTYGGARQAILQSQRESGLRTQLGDIQAQGLQRAYEQAQQQFERDRSAGLQAGQTRLAAAQGLGGLAQTFGGLGTQQLAGELDVLKTQGAFGDLQRSICTTADRCTTSGVAGSGSVRSDSGGPALQPLARCATLRYNATKHNPTAIVRQPVNRSWAYRLESVQPLGE